MSSEYRQPLPEASTILTMGILSIALTIFCCGPFGGIFGIIGLVKAKSAEKLFEANPEQYTDISNVKTGKILSYIGLAIAAVYLILTIVYFGVIIAFLARGDFSEFQ